MRAPWPGNMGLVPDDESCSFDRGAAAGGFDGIGAGAGTYAVCPAH